MTVRPSSSRRSVSPYAIIGTPRVSAPAALEAKSGRSSSSALSKMITSPVEQAMPLFHASPMPLSGSLRQKVRRFACRSMISRVPSVLAPSITTTSTGPWV